MVPTACPAPCPACGYPLDATPCSRCDGQVRGGVDGPLIRPGPRFPLADIAHGFVGFFRGALMLIHRPEFFGKLKLPILANILGLIAIFWLVFSPLHSVFEALLGADWAWLEFLRGGATDVLAFVLTMMAIFLLAPVIIETITAPFLDPLAQLTERTLGGPGMRPPEKSTMRSLTAGVRASAQILVIQLCLLVPLVLLSLTGIGVFLALIVTALLNALVWFDIPFARRGYNLRQRIAVLKRNWARALGFGLGFQVGAMIPPFNLLFLTPATAVAVSRLYLYFDKLPAETARASDLSGAAQSGSADSPC